MDVKTIPFADILKLYTKYDDVREKYTTDHQQYFNHITSVLFNPTHCIDERSLNITSRHSLHHRVVGLHQTSLIEQLVYVELNNLYISCIPYVPGKFNVKNFSEIIADLYEYRKYIKLFNQDESFAIKLFLNLLYGFVDKGKYDLYTSDREIGSFADDINIAARKLLGLVYGPYNLVYMDVDRLVLFVPDITKYKERLEMIIPNIQHTVTPLNQIAILGQKRVLAIDSNDHYIKI